MALQLGAVTGNVFEPLGPWQCLPYCEKVDQREDGTDIHRTSRALIRADVLAEQRASIVARNPLSGDHSRHSSGNRHEGRTASTTSTSSSSTLAMTLTSSETSLPCPFPRLTSSLSSFSFTHARSSSPTPFTFINADQSRQGSEARADLKRRRQASDVDGPNTGSLPCKKRRLRRHLITSRLSQPFSLPATHILNREAVAAGDKRFLKLAAIQNARRLSGAGQHAHTTMHPSPNEALRRAAVLNRFRLNVCHEAVQRGDDRIAEIARNAGLLQFSQGMSIVSARIPCVSTVSYGIDSIGTSVPSLSSPVPPCAQSQPPGRAALLAQQSPPGSPEGRLRPIGVSGQAAKLRLPSPRTSPRTSPRLRPRRRIPARERELTPNEIDDDGGSSFPDKDVDLEGMCEANDDLEEVYADFSVIFGGDGESSDEEREGLEDYMDDLDGIPWNAR